MQPAISNFDELLDKLARVTPEFAARAADADENRAYPLENVGALVDLGLAGIGLPKALGGLGLTLVQQLRLTEEIARADGSTALVLSMHRVSVDIVAACSNFPYGRRLLDEVAEEGALFCSVVSLPTTETDSRKAGLVAQDLGDAWLISGRSGFATNSEGARYIVLACSLADGPGMCIAPVPIDLPGIRLLRNWSGMGMRATASHDVQVEDLRIPKDQGYALKVEDLGALGDDNPQKGGQFAILGVWIGLAQAAFDFTVDYLAKRHGFMGGSGFNKLRPDMDQLRSDQAWAQIAVGEMDACLWQARAALYAFAEQFDAGVFESGPLIKPYRLRCNHVVRDMGERVVMAALKVCGAHAYVRDKPLERVVRDSLAGLVMKEKNDQLAQQLGALALSGARAELSPQSEPAHALA